MMQKQFCFRLIYEPHAAIPLIHTVWFVAVTDQSMLLPSPLHQSDHHKSLCCHYNHILCWITVHILFSNDSNNNFVLKVKGIVSIRDFHLGLSWRFVTHLTVITPSLKMPQHNCPVFKAPPPLWNKDIAEMPASCIDSHTTVSLIQIILHPINKA